MSQTRKNIASVQDEQAVFCPAQEKPVYSSKLNNRQHSDCTFYLQVTTVWGLHTVEVLPVV
jgi:hypothetical protein